MGGTPNNQFILNCFALYARLKIPPPKVIIETGTYFGKGASFFSAYFQKVHTIELSAKWHAKTSKLLAGHKNIKCYLGDSVNILPSLLPLFEQPLAFYLDAHYSGGETAKGETEVPVLDELKLITKRTYKDLIIIDDLRLFGSKGICGHENHKYYPPIKYDWSSITIESILNTITSKETAFSFTNDDRLIIILNLSKKEKLLLQTK